MEMIYWVLISIVFLIAFAGLIYPIIPSVLFILAGFLLYGALFTFADFNWLFWTIQILFILLLFGADYVANIFGIKRFGGSNAGMWGSTVGLLIGPFVIPVVGIIAGPFIGAVLGELAVNRTPLKQAFRIGFGSVIGFITSAVTKGFIQTVMIIIFLLWVL
ncbi:DUF456 domain-containing protein [Jeotgalibacillus proteolyticus]|uniref:DUF456 domain-containing protein n=1 Tax=Jeotgalibacillus proteolyticus TaxID=2082395 RepID=A0A2S5GES9_9BACL|nr:DUF456 domain-containing protein [Jeotgalibacillus proteolyticus]PPA71421.1 DUF456 domain-containing protein [Jeotgalibacillus proteolyticus]